MKVTHTNLVKLAQKLGYKIIEKGLCHSFSMQAIFAVLEHDMDTFVRRLNLIAYYASFDPNFEIFVQDIDSIKNKIKRREIVSKHEMAYLEVISFFDGIAMLQAPWQYSKLFNKSPSEAKAEKIHSFFSKNNQLRTYLHCHVGNRRSMLILFQKLESILLQHSKLTSDPMPMSVSGPDHTIMLQYQTQTNRWLLLDVNNFNRKFQRNEYFQSLDTTQLVDKLFETINISSSHEKCSLTLKLFTYSHYHKQLEHDFSSLTRFHKSQIDDPDSFRLLFSTAIIENDSKLIKKLLEHPFFTTNLNIFHVSPLHLACSLEHKTIVRLLLEKGVSPNVKPPKSALTPLYIACKRGNLKMAQLLVKYGADLNHDFFDGYSALHVACQYGYLDIVKLLIENGASVNRKYAGVQSPAHFAFDNKHHDVVAYLYKAHKEEQKKDHSSFIPPAKL